MKYVLKIDPEDINQTIELAKLEGIRISTMLNRLIRQYGFVETKDRRGIRIWVKDEVFWRAPTINHGLGKAAKERRLEVANIGGKAYRDKVSKERKREIARLGGKAKAEKMRRMKENNLQL